METRSEAGTIILMCANRGVIFGPATEEDVTNLIRAVSEWDSNIWQPYPLTALANAAKVSNIRYAGPVDHVLDYLADTTPLPLDTNWHAPFLDAVRDASEHYFIDAARQFELGDFLSATEDLCSAVNCAVMGQAAIHGWPHADGKDDLNTIVALATGNLPQDLDEAVKLLENSPDEGHALNSSHAATMGMPDAIRFGHFDENGYTPDLATSFARKAVQLATGLGNAVS